MIARILAAALVARVVGAALLAGVVLGGPGRGGDAPPPLKPVEQADELAFSNVDMFRLAVGAKF